MFNATVIGNLGADAEVVSSNGNQFITLSIADTRKFKRQDGTEMSETNWVDAIISKVDHPVLPYLRQGVKVCVQGQVTLRVYSSKKDRMMKAGATIHVSNIELCGGSSDAVPRRVINPENGQIFETQKFYWINADTKNMKKDELKQMVDERGNQYAMSNLGFVTPVEVHDNSGSEQVSEEGK